MLTDLNPTAVLEQLDAEALRARLDQLDRERAAVLVLLRAARARERAAGKRPRQEDRDAK